MIPSCTSQSCRSSLFALDLFVNCSQCLVNLHGQQTNIGGLSPGVAEGLAFKEQHLYISPRKQNSHRHPGERTSFDLNNLKFL